MMRRGNFHWPDRQTLRIYLVHGLAANAVFLAVYFGAHWLTARRADVHRIYFDWELSIPFIPEMIVAYLSLFLLFVLLPFRLEAERMRLLMRQIITGTLMAGFAYLLWPGTLGFERHVPEGWTAPLYEMLFRVDHAPYNLVPSLHVISGGLILMSLRDTSRGFEKAIYTVWMILIILSTILVHQHHLADVVGGLAVVLICRKLQAARLPQTGET